MADTTDIKRDVFIMFKDAICQIVDFQHVNPGKGSAFVRTRLKNVQTGKVLEHTYKAGEGIDVVDLDRTNMQFLYKDTNNFNFMDNNTYEQYAIPVDLIGDKGGYLKEGQEVQVLLHDATPLSIALPMKLTFKVVESMPAVKGDTSSGRVMKDATLDTGMVIKVPIFIEQGENVVVNTETGEYVERASSK
jgi:elongation factor P